MGVDPTADTTDSVRTSLWTCSYTVRVKRPVADRIVRISFRSVPMRMLIRNSFSCFLKFLELQRWLCIPS